MSNGDTPSERESRVDEIVDEYVRALQTGDAGTSVDREELAKQYPELEPELSKRLRFAEALARVIQKSDLEQMTVVFRQQAERHRCPHCGNAIQIVETNTEASCDSCGSNFALGHPTLTEDGPRQTIGHFAILEEVGHGGFGVVYRAVDTRLDRTVAIKIPRRGYFGSREEELRFLREARSAASLLHPGIVRVYEVGSADDSHFIVSEFVEGQTLGDLIKHEQLSFRETANLILQIADALSYAHEQHIIHRDVKPANILVDAQRRTHLTDFGLARGIEPAITMTREGELIGTPAYMSPEQAAAEHHKVDHRSDVYSLGVTLFRMLCGELPFRGSRRMLLSQVMNDDPPFPRRINEYVPKDLETIALKAMEKEQAKRYQTAGEFAAEVRRWLAGDPIHARPISPAEQMWRWCRKRPIISSLLALVTGLLLAIAVGAGLWGASEARLKGLAQASDIEGRYQLASAYSQRASERLDSNDPAGSLPHAVEALATLERLGDEKACQLKRVQVATAIRALPRLVHVEDLEETISQVELSLGGTRLLVAAGSSIRLLNTANWQSVGQAMQSPNQHGRSRFDSTGSRVAATYVDGPALLWDATTQRLIGKLAHEEPTNAVDAVFSPDGQLVATFGFDGTVRLWDANSGAAIASLTQPQKYAQRGAFSPDGELLVVASNDSYTTSHLSIWSVAERKLITESASNERRIGNVVFADSGEHFFITANDGDVEKWNRNGQKDDSYTVSEVRHASPIHRILVPVEPGRLLIADANGQTNIVDMTTKNVLIGPLDHGGGLGTVRGSGVAVSPDRTLFATGGFHERVHVRWTGNGAAAVPPLQHGAAVSAVGFASTGGEVLATGTTAGMLKIWDLASTTRGTVLLQHEGPVTSASFSGDSRRVVTTDRADVGTSVVWNAKTGEMIGSPVSHTDSAFDAGFTSDGRNAISVGRGGDIIVRNASGADTGPIIRKDDAPVDELALSPTDPAIYATGNYDGAIRLWRISEEEPLATFHHSKRTTSLVFHPDGKHLASSSQDGTARVWNIDLAKSVTEPLVSDAAIKWSVFSPDGTILATANLDGTVVFWDWKSGTTVRTITRSTQQSYLAFDATGQHLIVAEARAGIANIWEVSQTTAPLWTLSHPGIRRVDYHPKQSMALSAGGRGAVQKASYARLWDTSAGLPLTAPLIHSAPVDYATFSPDGTAAVTAAEDGTARIWSLEPTPHGIETLRDFVALLTGTRFQNDRTLSVSPAEQQKVFGQLRDQSDDDSVPEAALKNRWATLRELSKGS